MNRLNLDFSLSSDEARAEYVQTYIQNFDAEKPLTNSELEITRRCAELRKSGTLQSRPCKSESIRNNIFSIANLFLAILDCAEYLCN